MWHKYLIPFSFFMAVIFTPSVMYAADTGKHESRRAKYEFKQDDGIKVSRDKKVRCRDYMHGILEFTFPVEGGAIRDAVVSIDSSVLIDVEVLKDAEGLDGRAFATCIQSHDKGSLVSGDFAGGDGGQVQFTLQMKDQEGNSTKTRYQGKLFGNGNGKLQAWDPADPADKSPLTVRYTPFEGTCNVDLNAYGKKGRGIIMGALLNEAGDAAYKGLLDGASHLWKKTYDKIHLWELKTDRYAYRYRGFTKQRMPQKDLYQKWASKFMPDKAGRFHASPFIENITGNLSDVLDAISIADSALNGEYGKAAYSSAVTAVGMYSNGLGLLVAAGEAAHADWEAFAERAYEKQYREFYEQLYYSGGKPSLKKSRKSQRRRFREFMQESLFFVSGGNVGGAGKYGAGSTMGGGGGAQFRKMIMDYAYYKLQLSLSRADFGVTEGRGGKLRLNTKELGTVFWNLFDDFERTYQNDLYASLMKKVTAHTAKKLKSEFIDAGAKLAYAEGGNFMKVWDEKTYEGIFCNIVDDLREKGLLKSE